MYVHIFFFFGFLKVHVFCVENVLLRVDIETADVHIIFNYLFMLGKFVESHNKNVSRLHFGTPQSSVSLIFRNCNFAIELLKSNKGV